MIEGFLVVIGIWYKILLIKKFGVMFKFILYVVIKFLIKWLKIILFVFLFRFVLNLLIDFNVLICFLIDFL